MALTVFGCCALSTVPAVVQRTYWAGGEFTNTNITSNSQHTTMYLGIYSIELVNCAQVPGWYSYPSDCVRSSVLWTDPECMTGITKSACASCASIANTMASTAFMNCASLILSLLGAQTRIRFKADAPVQKLLGMGADLWGALSLAFSLFIYENSCYSHFRSAFDVPGINAKYTLGPGFFCYIFCVFAGLLRASVHWATPLPGKGKGFLVIKELFKWSNIRKCWPKNIDDTQSLRSHDSLNSKI